MTAPARAPTDRSPAVELTAVMVAAAALAAVMTLAIMRGGPPQVGLPVHWFLFGSFSIAGVAGWAIAVLRPRWLPATIALAAVLLVAASLVAAFASSRPGLSMPATWDLVTKAGTVLAVCAVARWRQGRRILLVAGVIVLVAVTGSYLVEVASRWLSWHRLGMPWTNVPMRPAAIGGIAGIPTWMADDALLLLPLVAVAAWRFRPYGRPLAVLLVLLVATCLVISQTRSLWLIAAAVFGLVLLGWLRSRAGARTVAIVAVVAAAALLAATVLGVVGRIGRSLDEGRTSAFSSALAQFTSHPLTGTGPATYPVERLSTVVPVFGHYAFPAAHNIVLDTAGETGVLGLAAMALAAILIGAALIVARRTSGAPRAMFTAALAGLSIVAAHSLVDIVFEVPGIFLAACLVFALAVVPELDVAAPSHPSPSVPWAAPGTPARLASVMAGSPGWIARITGDLRIVRGAGILALAALLLVAPVTVAVQRSIVGRVDSRIAAETDPRRALVAARNAADLQPDSAAAVIDVMVLEDATGNRDGAIAAARRLVALEGLAQHRIELAILLDRGGQRDSALSEARAALDRDAVDPFVQLNGTILLAGAGDTTGATAALTRLFIAEPLVGLQARALPPSVRALVPAAVSRAIQMNETSEAWDDALSMALTVDPRLADGVLAAAPAGDRAGLTRIRDAWLGDAAALADIERTVRSAPSSALLNWAWLLEARRCNTEAADRWGGIKGILDGAWPRVPVELAAATAPARMWPPYYPIYIYPVVSPPVPYVQGTWTYTPGTPACGLN